MEFLQCFFGYLNGYEIKMNIFFFIHDSFCQNR